MALIRTHPPEEIIVKVRILLLVRKNNNGSFDHFHDVHIRADFGGRCISHVDVTMSVMT